MRQVKGPGNGMGVRHGKDECWANGGGCNVGRGRGQLVGWPLSKSTCDWIFVWCAHRKGCQRQPRKKTGDSWPASLGQPDEARTKPMRVRSNGRPKSRKGNVG